MSSVRRSHWLVMTLAAVVLAGPLIEDAVAKRPKSHLSATVNGKRLKSSKRGIMGLYATSSFSVNGATKPRRGRVRSITVNCGPVNIKTVALPITLTDCFGAYTEAGRKAADFKQWTSGGMELTVESLDGDRIVGTFRGAIQASGANPGDPPASVEGGTFSLVLTGTGV
jgi:hypothetical protein